ncbi:MAG: uroporphyrinogen-III synthase [Planctomycetes bacterium]|nr:uroporphyrinogen-III synthase [Planctomycetota bacterium]
MASLPLEARTVVVTRSLRQAAPLVERLERLGARVVAVPAIRFAPADDLREWRAALEHRASISHLVFTSRNAVRFFLLLGEREAIPLAFWRARRVAAVGRGTGEELAAAGLPPDRVPGTQTGVDLAAELIEKEGVGPGSVLLVPRSAIAAPEAVDLLRAAGAGVHAPAIYQTLPQSPEMAEPLFALLDAGEPVDAVTFASPSALDGFLSMTGDRGRDLLRSPRTRIVAIGPTTAGAIREAGLEVAAEARQPGMDELAEAVVRALGSGG